MPEILQNKLSLVIKSLLHLQPQSASALCFAFVTYEHKMKRPTCSAHCDMEMIPLCVELKFAAPLTAP